MSQYIMQAYSDSKNQKGVAFLRAMAFGRQGVDITSHFELN